MGPATLLGGARAAAPAPHGAVRFFEALKGQTGVPMFFGIPGNVTWALSVGRVPGRVPVRFEAGSSAIAIMGLPKTAIPGCWMDRWDGIFDDKKGRFLLILWSTVQTIDAFRLEQQSWCFYALLL